MTSDPDMCADRPKAPGGTNWAALVTEMREKWAKKHPEAATKFVETKRETRGYLEDRFHELVDEHGLPGNTPETMRFMDLLFETKGGALEKRLARGAVRSALNRASMEGHSGLSWHKHGTSWQPRSKKQLVGMVNWLVDYYLSRPETYPPLPGLRELDL